LHRIFRLRRTRNGEKKMYIRPQKKERTHHLPYLDLNYCASNASVPSCVHDGISYAVEAVEFASLGLTAKQNDWTMPQLHLYALAIELAFKSAALRTEATLEECRKASHHTSRMIALIEQHGTVVPERLKTRLGDDSWFRTFLLLTRYPSLTDRNTSLDNTVFIHKDYPEMIADILEIPCKWPLQFDGGSALAEIKGAPRSHIIRILGRRQKIEI